MGRPEIVWKRMSRSREAEGAFMKGVRQTGCPAHRVLLETNHRRFRHIESPPCRGRLSAEWLSGISHAHDQKSARFTIPIVQQTFHHREHGEHRELVSKCLPKIGSVPSVFSVVRFLMPFEELDGPLVLFGSLQALEC